jgi:hypothetical protein
MAKERIEKTLIILDEDEIRQVLWLVRQGDPQEIYRFVADVIAQKVEAMLRKRCGEG